MHRLHLNISTGHVTRRQDIPCLSSAPSLVILILYTVFPASAFMLYVSQYPQQHEHIAFGETWHLTVPTCGLGITCIRGVLAWRCPISLVH